MNKNPAFMTDAELIAAYEASRVEDGAPLIQTLATEMTLRRLPVTASQNIATDAPERAPEDSAAGDRE